jgi:hypothetical protein
MCNWYKHELKIKNKEQSLENTKVRLNPELRPCASEMLALWVYQSIYYMLGKIFEMI